MPSSDPEKIREQNRRKYARIKADPVRHAAFKAAAKARSRDYQREKRAGTLESRQAAAKAQRQRRVDDYDNVRSLEKAHRERNKARYNANRREADRKRREAAATRARPVVCEVCETVGRRGVVYDHDHATEAFRGWLCDRCNRTLGLAGDDVRLLLKLSLYLEDHSLGLSDQGKEVEHVGKERTPEGWS